MRDHKSKGTSQLAFLSLTFEWMCMWVSVYLYECVWVCVCLIVSSAGDWTYSHPASRMIVPHPWPSSVPLPLAFSSPVVLSPNAMTLISLLLCDCNFATVMNVMSTCNIGILICRLSDTWTPKRFRPIGWEPGLVYLRPPPPLGCSLIFWGSLWSAFLF